MRALRSTSPGLGLFQVPVPDNCEEALIQVVMSGICGTDIEITRGYAGFAGTLGHEFVGIVKGGSVRSEMIGKRVVGEINVGCGVCSLCIAGDARHCESRTVLGIKGRDGAHAEFLNLPERCLHVLPDSISDEAAVFVEPLAAACGIAERVDLGRETRAAVIGDGRLGLLASYILSLISERVTLVGKHASKLKLAEARGVETVLAAETGSLGRQFDVVVEASGSETGFATALDLVRPRGKIVLKSTFHGTPRWEAWRVVVDEISIVGSRCGLFEPAIDLLGAGKVDVNDMVSDVFTLSDGVAAFEAASRPGALKILLSASV